MYQDAPSSIARQNWQEPRCPSVGDGLHTFVTNEKEQVGPISTYLCWDDAHFSFMGPKNAILTGWNVMKFTSLYYEIR